MIDSADARRKRGATARAFSMSINIVTRGHSLAALINGTTVSSALNIVRRVHQKVGTDLASEVSAGFVSVTARFVSHARGKTGKGSVRSTSCGRRGVGSAVDVIVGVAGNGDGFCSFASNSIDGCFVRVLNQSGGTWVSGADAFIGVASKSGTFGVGVGHGVSSVAREYQARVGYFRGDS